ncbi:MAG: PAS domain-containing protein, partial [Deinococcus sp.]|nr:PAS domain-containing protein [Deinococcus sp.]
MAKATGHKGADEELCRLAAFPEENPHPTLEMDLAGLVTYLNPAARAYFPDLLTAGAQHPILEGLPQVLARLQNTGEKTLVREIMFDTSIYEQHVVLHGNALQIYLADVTERKQAEQALRQVKLVIENSPAVLFQWRAEPGWPVELVSENIAQFGYSAAELLSGSLPYLALVHPDDRHRVQREIEMHVERGDERWAQQYRLVTGEGRTRWVDSRMVVERDPTGRLTHYQGIIIDITEYKQLEAQFLQLQKMESICRLADGVAHDFSNLLSVIAGYGELLVRHLDPGHPLRQHAEEVQRVANRAATLTRQLLAFSRKQVLQPKVLDLNAVVANVSQLLQRVLEKQITLAIIPGEELGQVKADPGQLEQVILNLAINARDAMPQGGTLTIAT